MAVFRGAHKQSHTRASSRLDDILRTMRNDPDDFDAMCERISEGDYSNPSAEVERLPNH